MIFTFIYIYRATEFKEMFNNEFTSVGENNAILIRESQHTYRMICTGRANCIGLQVNLRVSIIYIILDLYICLTNI